MEENESSQKTTGPAGCLQAVLDGVCTPTSSKGQTETVTRSTAFPRGKDTRGTWSRVTLRPAAAPQLTEHQRRVKASVTRHFRKRVP